MPSADCGVFEVGERSEVGALESHPWQTEGITKKSPSLRKDFYEQSNLSLLK